MSAGVDIKRSSGIATMYVRCDVEPCEFRPSTCRTFVLDLMKLIFLPATTLFRPQPERQAQPLGAGQDAIVGFRQVAAIAALVAIEFQRRSDGG